MRIDEITINIPIKIDLSGDKPRINVAGQDADDEELDQNPVMMAPLQQELELKKAELGKKSPVIDKMTDENDIGNEDNDNDTDDNIKNLKTLAGLKNT